MRKATRKVAIKILERAKKRIERGWCQGAFARNSDNFAVDADSKQAVKWCLAGSINADGRASWDNRDAAYHFMVEALSKKGYTFPSSYNDKPSRKKADVVKLLQSAIQLAEMK